MKFVKTAALALALMFVASAEVSAQTTATTAGRARKFDAVGATEPGHSPRW